MTDSQASQSGRQCPDEAAIAAKIHEINSQIAQFRDQLLTIGQSRDCPELREKIRKTRRDCVNACKKASEMVLPQMRSAMESGIPADSPNLVLLFFLAQLFLRELHKSKNLVRVVPMDMTGYFGEEQVGPVEHQQRDHADTAVSANHAGLQRGGDQQHTEGLGGHKRSRCRAPGVHAAIRSRHRETSGPAGGGESAESQQRRPQESPLGGPKQQAAVLPAGYLQVLLLRGKAQLPLILESQWSSSWPGASTSSPPSSSSSSSSSISAEKDQRPHSSKRQQRRLLRGTCSVDLAPSCCDFFATALDCPIISAR
uniref:Syntaxin N-terminal domain-containing protein n=1 Tax=Trichogramma kaykai TaxID=54128 RepID=A0ABD2W3S7_9HYME